MQQLQALTTKIFTALILVVAFSLLAPVQVHASETCGSKGFSINPEYYEVDSGASSHIISLFSDETLDGQYQIRVFDGGPNPVAEITHTEWTTATSVNGKNVLNFTISDPDALTSDVMNDLQFYLFKDRPFNPFDEEVCHGGYYVIVPEGQTAPPEPVNAATPHYTVQPDPIEPEPEAPTPSPAASAPSPSPEAALPASSVICGNWFDPSAQSCSCSGSPQESVGSQTCCGWINGIRCDNTAPDPSPAQVCGVISGANCIIDGTSHSWGDFQLCPNNTVACCFETAQCPASDGTGCGTWQGAQCVTSDGRIVNGAITCSTDSSQCCSAASLCPAEPPGTSPPPAEPGGPGPGDPPSTDPIDIISGPKPEDFDKLNPLKTNNSPYADQLSSPGGVVSRIITFAFPLAGLLLFVMLVWGGFEMLSRGATQKSMDAGRQRVTAALIGFMLLFVSFWIMRIIEVIFGVAVI